MDDLTDTLISLGILAGMAGVAYDMWRRQRHTGGPAVLSDWNGRCPDCDSVLFILGPRAGISQNMTCSSCGCRINVTEHPTIGKKFDRI